VVKYAGKGVRTIAFVMDAFIPIMVGMSARLPFNRIKIRVFPRRLIEMTVNCNIYTLGSFQGIALNLSWN
jgi:hypothetical protein